MKEQWQTEIKFGDVKVSTGIVGISKRVAVRKRFKLRIYKLNNKNVNKSANFNYEVALAA